jgi:HlyD family secretion protein
MQAPTLFVIAQDLTEMHVNASVDESDIGKVQAGQPVRFRVDAYPNETFAGTISQVRLQPVVEQNVVSYVTVIDVANKQQKLKPGMTAAVTIETGRASDVLKVPTSALRFQPNSEVFAKLGQQPPATRDTDNAKPSADRGNDRRAVWVLVGGRLTRVPVKTGLSDGAQTEITGDLNPGVHVATGLTSGNDATTTSAPRSPLLPTGRRAGGGRS